MTLTDNVETAKVKKEIESGQVGDSFAEIIRLLRKIAGELP